MSNILKNWFLLQFKPNAHKLAKRNLQLQGFETFLPLQEITVRKKTSFIKVKFLEEKIKSNKTIDLINFFTKNKTNEIYFIMGADNLVEFHKWHKWKNISEK